MINTCNVRTEKHSDLAASLPAKHAKDQSCTNCHANAGFVSSVVSTDIHHTQIGVACESCHGPALEHVRLQRAIYPRSSSRTAIRAGRSAIN